LFHRDRNRSDSREADFVALYVSDKAAINEVVMPPVTSFATILFGQLDAVAFDPINRTNVDSVRADNFHVLLDVGHWKFLHARTVHTLSVLQRLSDLSTRLRLLPTFLTALFTAALDLPDFFAS
jgi:hypothetical protein